VQTGSEVESRYGLEPEKKKFGAGPESDRKEKVGPGTLSIGNHRIEENICDYFYRKETYSKEMNIIFILI